MHDPSRVPRVAAFDCQLRIHIVKLLAKSPRDAQRKRRIDLLVLAMKAELQPISIGIRFQGCHKFQRRLAFLRSLLEDI